MYCRRDLAVPVNLRIQSNFDALENAIADLHRTVRVARLVEVLLRYPPEIVHSISANQQNRAYSSKEVKMTGFKKEIQS